MFSPLGGQENFFLNVGLAPIDFSCPKTHVLNKWYQVSQQKDPLLFNYSRGEPFGGHSPKNIFSRLLTYIGVKSCETSIARIPEAWKRFLDPDSGKESVYWSENQTFLDFYEKTVYIQGVSKVRKHLNFSIKMCLFIITKTTTIQNVLSWPVFVTSSFSVALNSLVDGGIWDTQN